MRKVEIKRFEVKREVNEAVEKMEVYVVVDGETFKLFKENFKDARRKNAIIKGIAKEIVLEWLESANRIPERIKKLFKKHLRVKLRRGELWFEIPSMVWQEVVNDHAEMIERENFKFHPADDLERALKHVLEGYGYTAEIEKAFEEAKTLRSYNYYDEMIGKTVWKDVFLKTGKETIRLPHLFVYTPNFTHRVAAILKNRLTSARS